MADASLRASQLTMARYLRNPDTEPPPAEVEPRRLRIYEDLVYNNIEGFISAGFPVLRSLYDAAAWRALVRKFIHQHRCRTPYFLEISQEFIQFLMHDYERGAGDPPFMAELAHYEWVELALDIAEEVLPRAVEVDEILAAVPRLSPLAWLLSYTFPVHRVGPAFRPAAATEPTYLVVYRNRADRVRFMALNATTARLLELVRGNDTGTVGALLAQLAGELGVTAESILTYGSGQFEQLHAESIVLLTNP